MGSQHQPPPASGAQGFAHKLGQLVGLLAAVLAMLLVILGIGALTTAIVAAWSLYETPSGIEPYAAYFAGILPGAIGEGDTRQGLGKLVAWIFVVLMLLVLGKLGSWAVGAGARLIRPPDSRRD